jgi:hypothetical protein
MANSQIKEIKFSPHTQGKAQSATYATVKDAIIQHVQKTYKDSNDVAQSLKEATMIDLTKEKPVRSISTQEDATKASVEQSGMDREYQEELRRFLDHEDSLHQGLYKAYALIIGNYCTRPMQARVEEHPEFESKIENNPIELLEVIKTLMHDPVRAQYPMVSMSEALTRLVNVKQFEGEQLLDYIKRFKQTRDVAKSHMGSDLLNRFVEQSEEYRNLDEKEGADAKKKMKDDAYSAWMAYLLLRGSDQSKYGTIMKGFVAQYSLGNDQYPRTVQMATDVLSNHRLDAKFFENQKRQRERQQNDRNKGQDDNATTATSFTQGRDVVCYICGKAGHTKPECPDADKIPRNKWHVN